VLNGEVRLAVSILERGLEVADLREGEASLSDLWLLVHNTSPGPAAGQPRVPFVYDFRLADP
jgi:hypothetical protein